MRLGAQDYFIKGDLKRLPSAVTRELKDSLARRNHRLSQERIHYLANYDSLTGLPNRILFKELAAQRIADVTLQGRACLFILNVDRFRDVNDHLGTAAGDKLLTELAQRLCEVVGGCGARGNNVVARLSADEFAIIVADLDGEAEATLMARKILSVLARPFFLSRYDWRINASVGCAMFQTGSTAGDYLMSNATMALHHAQQTAGNSHFFYFDGMRAQLQEKLQLTHDLEQAVENKNFQLQYDSGILPAEAIGSIGSFACSCKWLDSSIRLTRHQHEPGRIQAKTQVYVACYQKKYIHARAFYPRPAITPPSHKISVPVR